jgi:serine/threonine protein phosphatase 1
MTRSENLAIVRGWLERGGTTTITSYFGACDEIYPDEIASIAKNYPEHLAALDGASILEFAGRYAFVHAGVDPLLPFKLSRPKTT